MKDRIFVDTNVLIYAYSNSDMLKKNCINNLFSYDIEFIISTQVINEFINVMHKKLKVNYGDITNGLAEIHNFFDVKLINTETIHLALNIAQLHNYSYFDSLMIASALENRCIKIFSEDMHNGHIIENLLIQNPFIVNVV